jgi:UDP-N-acetylmuramoyl-L-alanyl-D-glutamate--2,6-diaminopimelate ligase
VVGVTGTNGKTTVVSLLSQIVEAAGQRARVVGTLTGSLTTPESTDLARLLAEAVDDGVDVVAMECSSHALALERVTGVHFEVAAFTNLGSDHLDFHGTQERYFEAKARLFEPGRARVAVLNVDDVHGRLLRDTLVGERDPAVVEVSAEAAEPVVEGTGSRFRWRDHEVHLPLAGRFNVTNALVAAECAVALGLPVEAVAAALPALVAPAGRFERVDAGQPFTVVVDFAHTPDALARVLEAARELASGQVVVVFGAGGDRDPSKRGPMGEAACRGADVVIVTSDNPRSEDPSAIMSAVAAGCVGGSPILEVDRRAAIRAALQGRSRGDVVVIAGKGHEATQTVGELVVPFDDRAVAREVLAELGWAG